MTEHLPLGQVLFSDKGLDAGPNRSVPERERLLAIAQPLSGGPTKIWHSLPRQWDLDQKMLNRPGAWAHFGAQ